MHHRARDCVSPAPLTSRERSRALKRDVEGTQQTAAEARHDRARMKRLQELMREHAPWCTLNLAGAELWCDRWRIPITLRPDNDNSDASGSYAPSVCVKESHFAAVRACGASLIAEEHFEDVSLRRRRCGTDNTNYYVEMTRSRFRGWKAWSWRERGQCVGGTAMCCVSTAMVLGWYLWDVWAAALQETSS